MRGHFDSQPMIIAYINLEKRVPQDHPLREIKSMADQELKRLSPLFNEMYSHTGRPSIPPERILKSLLLKILNLFLDTLDPSGKIPPAISSLVWRRLDETISLSFLGFPILASSHLIR